MNRLHRGWLETLGGAALLLVTAAALKADQTVIVGPGTAFSPSAVTIAPGETVTWDFRARHSSTSDATSGPEVWDSGILSTGTFSHTFTTPGSYPYYCTLHSVPGGTMMNGVVQVTGAGATATPTVPASSTPTSTPTVESPTATPTPTSTPKVAPPTATPAATSTPSPTEVATPIATATATPLPTVIGSPSPTVTAVATATPVAPSTPTPAATSAPGPVAAGIPLLDPAGRLLLALALAAVGIVVLTLAARR